MAPTYAIDRMPSMGPVTKSLSGGAVGGSLNAFVIEEIGLTLLVTG